MPGLVRFQRVEIAFSSGDAGFFLDNQGEFVIWQPISRLEDLPDQYLRIEMREILKADGLGWCDVSKLSEGREFLEIRVCAGHFENMPRYGLLFSTIMIVIGDSKPLLNPFLLPTVVVVVDVEYCVEDLEAVPDEGGVLQPLLAFGERTGRGGTHPYYVGLEQRALHMGATALVLVLGYPLGRGAVGGSPGT